MSALRKERLEEAMTSAVADQDLITVVVGRFDPLVTRGLADVLRHDERLDVLAEDLESGALERAVAETAPRVAILDKPADGSALTRLRSIGPATGLLVLADDPARPYGMLLLASGVTCLARRVSPQDLLAIVQLVADGENVFGAADGRVERHDGPLLTPRETEVLWQLIEGRSPKQVAAALRIGVRTVNTYAEQGYRKLNVRNMRELADCGVQTSVRSTDY
jgi:DNA-binding NarL/FixJ family response regulator